MGIFVLKCAWAFTAVSLKVYSKFILTINLLFIPKSECAVYISEAQMFERVFRMLSKGNNIEDVIDAFHDVIFTK